MSAGDWLVGELVAVTRQQRRTNVASATFEVRVQTCGLLELLLNEMTDIIAAEEPRASTKEALALELIRQLMHVAEDERQQPRTLGFVLRRLWEMQHGNAGETGYVEPEKKRWIEERGRHWGTRSRTGAGRTDHAGRIQPTQGPDA